MRLTEFWARMRAHLDPGYVDSFCRDQVIAELGERTVHQALSDGLPAKDVWRAVCNTLGLPRSAH
ncbi:hypothetical protein BIV57_15385 [Mangrovactinospora gilvigrisea]|uniref:DUF3046 domain-containing protein n=1 Tax=Mangrovactinospora gilvigrisea TaxID=1428644 RepID=A0A1J7BD53_9ACTN|nr:DUF3046 domain-containing protein [Mangrovactinospora gilvigrisea]OIV36607.1 hypothetical protein BIV57_15385 [Mangrovactinospora gilvigrisea]